VGIKREFELPPVFKAAMERLFLRFAVALDRGGGGDFRPERGELPVFFCKEARLPVEWARCEFAKLCCGG